MSPTTKVVRGEKHWTVYVFYAAMALMAATVVVVVVLVLAVGDLRGVVRGLDASVAERNELLNDIEQSVNDIKRVANEVEQNGGGGDNQAVTDALTEIHNICVGLQNELPELVCVDG